MSIKYKRVLLKLSGEAISGKENGIIMGKIGKFYDNNCLVDMEYVKSDDHEKVGKYVENTAKALGGKIAITGFVRFEKGEGIQKREDNFAEEIAKLTSK